MLNRVTTAAQRLSPRTRTILIFLLVLVVLLVIYTPTVLTRINGGDDPYMDDVGEIQVALNIWGTIHHTGYPLYTILGNIFVTVLKAIGVQAVVAPNLYAMVWGIVALATFFALINHLTGKVEIAAVTTLILGLARSIWIHNVVAEVYSMSFAAQVVLLTVALWSTVNTSTESRRRIWLLALIGGIGVSHHRMVIFMAPGLILAVWPGIQAEWRKGRWRRLAVTFGVALLIGLIGFIPYVYLPTRALAHADWVYNNPSTLTGFWHEFTGAEAAFLMQTPSSAGGWTNDFVDTFRILVVELTPLFALASGVSLVWAMLWSRFKREARIAFVCTLGYFWFLFFLHRVVMPQAVAMPIVMIMVLGLAFGLDALVTRLPSAAIRYGLTVALAIVAIIASVPAQHDFIYALTHSNTGLESIELAKRVPREGGKSVLMLPWGPRFTAVAFSKYVTKENADLPLVNHNADLAAVMAQGNQLYTSKDTFYRFPLSWWDEKLGHVYLYSAGNEVVAVRLAPLTQQAGSAQPIAHGVILRNASYCKTAAQINITLTWGAEQPPDADLSVFMKLLNGDAVIAQADSNAPVYGWYPTSRWTKDEVVYDTYTLPLIPEATAFTFGMYEQKPSGEFVNYGTTKVPVASLFSCGS